jgi:RNA polymerase sigma-70 factor (ECF subfamily)
MSISRTAQVHEVAPASDIEAPLAGQVTAAMTGDSAAFEALLRSRLDHTYRTARAILGNDADARDAVQNAWLAAWRQLPRLREPAAFDAWLDRILINACRSSLRRRGRVREIQVATPPDVIAPSPGPEQVAERDALERAFARLSVEQRSVIVLHHLHRRPVADIASALGVPEGTVKWRLHAARSALDGALGEDR